MDIKALYSILNSAWFIEPQAAQVYGGLLDSFLQTGQSPFEDSRQKNIATSYRIDQKGNKSSTGNIQVFDLQGVVMKYDNCGNPGSQTWTNNTIAANNDPSIHAIIFLIDSPGGSIGGLEGFADAIRDCDKPTFAFTDTLMCSAAYWLGSSCDVVVASSANNGYATKIGCIGTMITVRDYRKKLEQEGIVETIILADKSHDKNSEYFEVINGNHKNIKAELNAINDTFLSAVKSNRSGKLKLELEDVLTGKTYNSNQALAYGLIDQIGTFSDVVTLAAKASITYSKTNRHMSNSNTPFEAALIAADAQSFPQVETTDKQSGFLLSEEHLTNISTAIKTANTTNKTLAEKVSTLEANAEQNNDATAKLEAMTSKEAATAQKLADAEAKVAELNEQLASAKDGATQFFSGTGSDKQDPAGAHETAKDKVFDNMPHNRAADELGIG